MLTNHRSDPPAGRPLLVYDGDCARCRRWVALAVSLDVERRVDTLRLRDPAAVDATQRSEAYLRQAVHLVRADGTVVNGAEAVRDLFRYLRGGRLVGAIFRVPGCMWVARRVYGWVARRRAREVGLERPNVSHNVIL